MTRTALRITASALYRGAVRAGWAARRVLFEPDRSRMRRDADGAVNGWRGSIPQFP